MALVVCSTSAAASPLPSSSSLTALPSSAIPIGSLHGKILFTRAGGKFRDETVFAADAHGKHVRRITSSGTSCCPRWSPDGMHILISALSPDGRITAGIVNPDGSNERVLPLPPGTLNLGCAQAWSATTGRMACEGWDVSAPRRNGLYAVRASDSADIMRVTHSGGSNHDIPMDYSLDGSWIFFLRESVSQQFEVPGSLFVVRSNGTGLRRLTPAALPVDLIGSSGGRLSPDGRRIVFTRSGVIWVINADGSGLRKVFQDRKGRLAITPTWSPDGHLILFGLDPPGSAANIVAQPPNGLYVIRTDGSGLTRVLVSRDWKREPDWTAAR